MLKPADFENLVWDFLLTYRQFLLHGHLHKRVTHEAYEANIATWNTLLLSVESGALLGLARLLERTNDIGKPFSDLVGRTFDNKEFDTNELDDIAERILKLRHAYIAHADLSKMRNMESFLKAHRLNGTEMIKMIDAIKNRLIQYQKSLSSNIEVQRLFTESQNNALHELEAWLKSFANPL